DAVPIVAHHDLDLGVAVADDHLGAGCVRVLDRVRQSFLNEAVCRQIDPGWQCATSSGATQLARPAGLACLFHQPVEMFEARLRRQRGCLLRPPEHTDHAAHLRQGFPARALDDQQRLALALLVGTQQAAHARRLHRHDTDAVADDVVQLARDARTLLGDGISRTLFALTLGGCRALSRVVGLDELPSEREPGDPNDHEKQADEDELSELPPGIVADDDRLDADGQSQAGYCLTPVGQLSDEEDGSATDKRSNEVAWDERALCERRNYGDHADCDRGGERKPPAEEQRQDEARGQHDVEPHRALGTVFLAVIDNCSGDRQSERGNEQNVEPVTSRKRPEPLHTRNVLRTTRLRVGRKNERRIILEDEPRSGATRSSCASDSEWETLRVAPNEQHLRQGDCEAAGSTRSENAGHTSRRWRCSIATIRSSWWSTPSQAFSRSRQRRRSSGWHGSSRLPGV